VIFKHSSLIVFGVSKNNDANYNILYFPFSALTLLVGQQEGHLVCK